MGAAAMTMEEEGMGGEGAGGMRCHLGRTETTICLLQCLSPL